MTMWMYVSLYLFVGCLAGPFGAVDTRNVSAGILAAFFWPLLLLAIVFTIVMSGFRR